MPKCTDCGEHFSSRTKINGIIKQLRNRKRCLNCNPFNNKNCQKFDGIKNCDSCDREFKYKNGKRLKNCNSCYTKLRREKFKSQAIIYKGGSCSVCGYDRCSQSLVFHHLNPNEKSFNISNAYCRSWENVVKELDKCILLCHNCHDEFHAGLISLENLAPVA